jgi:TetR/AcrR family transcriptional regulator, transcriptional repressor for nem operon
MPRVSREQADSNRVAIVDASSRLFRERGIDGVSVSELMAEAGLTHGGFYGHFESKDALAAAACACAFQRSTEKWRRRVAGSVDDDSARMELVDGYLSSKSRSSAGTSCPTAALAGDVAREPGESPIRAAFAAGVEDLLGVLERLQQTGAPAADRREALADLSSMVGALILARATSGRNISDEFLSATRERLRKSARRTRAQHVR